LEIWSLYPVDSKYSDRRGVASRVQGAFGSQPTTILELSLAQRPALYIKDFLAYVEADIIVVYQNSHDIVYIHKANMAELRVFQFSDKKVQTLDEYDRVIFTTIYDWHVFHPTITTLYRGSEDAGDVLAMFKGSKVTFEGEERKQSEMIYGNGNMTR
jgi:hypothetical protein